MRGIEPLGINRYLRIANSMRTPMISTIANIVGITPTVDTPFATFVLVETELL